MPITRRQFLRGASLVGAAGAIPVLRGLSVELNTRELPLWNDDGPALRLAHLTDLHSSTVISLDHIQSAIDLALSARPDLACFTGDYVNAVAPDPDGLVRVLRRLADHVPCFACLGNHDGGRWSANRGGPATPDAVIDLLRAAGIHVLHDTTEAVTLHDRRLLLTGVADLWSSDVDPARAGFAPDTDPRIVLAHNPDTKDALRHQPWQLMLSGHTHGGQIRLPFFGGRLTAPVKDDRYIEGLLPWHDRHLHISRGIGALAGLRLNCPPEVNLLTLT